jgi:hypothetical protein
MMSKKASARLFFSLVLSLGFSALTALSGCAKGGEDIATPDGGYDLGGHEVKPGVGTDDQQPERHLVLDQATTLRYMRSEVLEAKIDIPLGTEISLPADYLVQQANFRQTDGSIAWSSTGFIQGAKIISVPPKFSTQFPQVVIDQLNQTVGGLYVFASVIGGLQGVEGAFDAVAPGAPGAGFVKYYETSGKPKFNFSARIRKRWGVHVNSAVDPSSQSAAERLKWTRIYDELRKASDRTVQTPKSFLMIDKAEAVKRADKFEKSGSVPVNGAWTIAVQVSAPRHGFAPTPCAEFMSEMVREAYQRAGYDVSADFNSAKGNRLLWSDSAAVVRFSNALDKAGWVPWDTTQFRPPIGAVLMNEDGQTPGHTFMAAGDDGRIIMDNGAPQGRDLRKTVEHTIGIMFIEGVFFLPPGILPEKW